MACKHACTCGGFCPGCSSYEKESYFGEAEDMLSQQMGYRDYEDHMAHEAASRQEHWGQPENIVQQAQERH